MAHFVGLVLAQWLLRQLQKYLANDNDDYAATSAPPAPAGY
jgi:hypothetical protein